MAIEHPDHQDVNAGTTLGELPRQVRQERRELYGKEPIDQGAPGIVNLMPGTPRIEPPEPPLMPRPRDVRGQNAALVAAENAPFGLPATDYLIQSVFDARPINANDFQFYDIVSLDPNGDVGTPVNTRTISFTVPDGRVGILRRFDWNGQDILIQPIMDVDSTIDELSPVFVALSVSGFVQTTYERIFQQEGTREFYAVAFEKETFDFTVTINPNYSGSLAGVELGWFVQFYGNLLDTRGREKQYEPANEYRAGLLK